jgi:hypothetical protein
VRGLALLVVGLAAGLGAGWALFAGDRPADRAPRASTARESPPDPIPSPAETRGEEPSGIVAAGPKAGTRAAPLPASEEAIIRRLVREAYAQRVKDGREPPPDLLEAAVREVVRGSAAHRTSLAQGLGYAVEYRESTRAAVGEITGSPLLLQMSVARDGQVRLTERGNSGPLRIDGPPAPGAKEIHVTPGIVPPGRTFLIERVVLRAYLAAPHPSLTVELPETGALGWDAQRDLDTELTGLVRLRHGDENRLRLHGRAVAASLEVHGRLVSEAEGESVAARPLVMGDGWLTREPVVMQVFADHGGGNPRTVYLDGGLYRIDALEPDSIWTDTPDWDRRGSRAYYSGCGRVPSGKAYRITRVAYRACLREDDHSDLVVIVGGETRVKANGSQGTVVSGTWDGDVLILPGRERDVSVTCDYFGLAEVVVYGEVVEAPRAR